MQFMQSSLLKMSFDLLKLECRMREKRGETISRSQSRLGAVKDIAYLSIDTGTDCTGKACRLHCPNPIKTQKWPLVQDEWGSETLTSQSIISIRPVCSPYLDKKVLVHRTWTDNMMAYLHLLSSSEKWEQLILTKKISWAVPWEVQLKFSSLKWLFRITCKV